LRRHESLLSSTTSYVTIDVLTFSAPKPRTGTAKVYLDEDVIAIRVPYERVIVKAVKQIPAVSWNAKKHYWQAPASSVLNVMEWAEKFDVPVEPAVSAMSDEVTERMNQFIECVSLNRSRNRDTNTSR